MKSEGPRKACSPGPRFEALAARLMLSADALALADAPVDPAECQPSLTQREAEATAESPAADVSVALPPQAEAPEADVAAAAQVQATPPGQAPPTEDAADDAAPAAAEQPPPPFIPSDPANSPIGEAKGIYPGRVTWVHDPAATSWDGSSGYWWDDANTDQAAVDRMLSDGLQWLSGQGSAAAAWDGLFRHFNQTHGKGNVPYAPGEKVVIKANLNTQTTYDDRDNHSDLSPHLLLALLNQLVTEAGVAQSDISVYDSIKHFSNKMYDKCYAAFPNVHYVDQVGGSGREKVQSSDEPELFYSNGTMEDHLPKCVVSAEYMVNLAILKKHEMAGVTVCGKNHFGSLIRTPEHLHPFLPVNQSQMGTFNPMVDIISNEHLGGKTMLYLVDGLYGGWRSGGGGSTPVRWQLDPFNNDWPSSLLLSQDPIAIDSVALDFIRAEDYIPSGGAAMVNHTDNYLHEAALADNAPSGTDYGCASLGVHEHWDGETTKQYTRNLGTGEGIELISSDPGTNRPPTVEIAEPADQAAFPRGADVSIAADAGDTDGTVVRVEFFANGESLAVDTDGGDGWGCTFAAPPPGEYTLKAKATDDQDALAWSAPVTITVGSVVTIEATDPDASESGEAGTFTVFRSGETTDPLEVQLTVDGTADAGSDYQTLADHVTIPAGAGYAALTVAPLDDLDAEGDETVTVALAASADYGVGSPGEATVTIADDEMPPGLLAWWTFDTIAGDTAPDSSGHGRDLQVVEATPYAQGRIGGALQFDGSGDYAVDEDGEDYINGLSAVTVAMWIKSDVTETDRGFFTTRDPGNSDCLNIRYDREGYYGDKLDVIKAYIQTTDGMRQNEGEQNTQTTAWQHVALTWASGGGMALYVDGALQQWSHDEGAVGGTLSNATKAIVGRGYKSTEGEWDGLIDDARIYSRALGAEEIRRIMTAPPTVSLTAPAEATIVAEGSQFAAAAEAADSDGTIDRVEFWDVTSVLKLAEATEAPYECTLTAAELGTRRLVARAFDDAGAAAVSDGVTLIVAIGGDTDLDDDVDFADYVTTKGNFGMAAGAEWAHGDSDRDGDVDFLDYITAKGNFGRSASAGGVLMLGGSEPADGPPAAAPPVGDALRLGQRAAAAAVAGVQIRPVQPAPVPPGAASGDAQPPGKRGGDVTVPADEAAAADAPQPAATLEPVRDVLDVLLVSKRLLEPPG